MSETPHRRWFRLAFSLRTMFVVVTLFACWLGYALNWIHQRQAEAETTKHLMILYNLGSSNSGFTIMLGRPDAPWPLQWMGDKGVAGIVVKPTTSDSEINRLQKLFPEASVRRE